MEKIVFPPLLKRQWFYLDFEAFQIDICPVEQFPLEYLNWSCIINTLQPSFNKHVFWRYLKVNVEKSKQSFVSVLNIKIASLILNLKCREKKKRSGCNWSSNKKSKQKGTETTTTRWTHDLSESQAVELILKRSFN